MNRLVLSALVFLIGSGAGAVAQNVDDLKIQNRSHFEAPPEGRNPFLPIGWQKPEAAPEVSTPETVQRPAAARATGPSTAFFRPENFTVTSISIGALPLALINGKAYGEGDLIAVTTGGQKVSVQVISIRDGVVTLRYAGKEITTAIKGAHVPDQQGSRGQ